ncbi:MAG: hypothetical protein LBH16_09280 [Treponema sp.]|jgi:hypothetical protein|nr:hypothetical protein [Treponema sp.]
MNNEMPLIGDDGTLYTSEGLDNEVVGNGTAALSNPGVYLITAVGTDSFFPAGLKAGEAYPADGSEVLKTGDKARRIKLEEAADVTGWNLGVTKDQIDVTRLKDTYKKFRPGKKDANGTMSMIFTMGVTDRAGGLVDQMMKTVRKGDNAVVVRDAGEQPLYFVGYIRKTGIPGETEAFVFGQIYLYGISFGGKSNEAQSFESSFKLTGIDPIFYSIDIPLTAN